jgi:NitT/TauT family transport system ATP-binding protein
VPARRKLPGNPIGALDALTREQLMIDLQRMLAATRQTVLFVTHSISEAVFQSDRVVELSPRPGRVERIWSIDLPRPRRVRVTTDPAFTGYVEAITQLFMSKGIIRAEMEEPPA